MILLRPCNSLPRTLRQKEELLKLAQCCIGSYTKRANDGASISTHVSEDGKTPNMVDVGNKVVTRRSATARSIVRLPHEIVSRIGASGEVIGPKGPITATAIIAGVLGAKATSQLIPFCHPLPIDDCKIDITLVEENTALQVDCSVRVTHRTGVEMEAMVGASIASLTIYDMLKGISHDIVIESTQLLKKSGGKRDFDREKA